MRGLGPSPQPRVRQEGRRETGALFCIFVTRMLRGCASEGCTSPALSARLRWSVDRLPRSVWRKHPRADIESLLASIASGGLLQNLCVVAGENNRFEVEAGGRRRLALKLLAQTWAASRSPSVPCSLNRTWR